MPKVRAWSNTVRRGDFHPADVDLFVLRDREDVLRALGRERADGGRDAADASAPARSWSGPRTVAMLAPVFAIAAYGGPVPGNNARVADPMPEGVAVVYLALIFLVAAPGPAMVAHRWWRGHRRWTWLEIVYLVLTVVMGARVLLSMIADWTTGPLGLWSIPVWLTVLTASGVLAAQLVASRGRRTQGDLCFRVVGTPDADRVRELVADLPPRKREELLDMRIRAVATLTERGLVAEDEAAQITAAPLGEAPQQRW